MTYMEGVMCRGLNNWKEATVGGVVGGVAAVTVNWVQNSGLIRVVSRNLPRLHNWKVAFVVGGIFPALGGHLAKTFAPNRPMNFDIYPILGMMASIPASMYFADVSFKEASVYAGIGSLVALAVKHFPSLGKRQQSYGTL